MPEQAGAVEVVLDAITVGVRYRQQVGSVDKLAESIARLGMLQPITITPDRVLVCGWRRLEAVRSLGWTSIRAWVRPGLSDDAVRVLAEHDENFLREAYTKTEQARLYQEFKAILSEEAAARRAAHQFGTVPDAGLVAKGADGTFGDGDEADELGSVDSTGPEELGKPGSARQQAALLATGRQSWQVMERISKLMDLAEDPEVPEEIRQLATEASHRIDDGAPCKPEWDRVQAALAALKPATPAKDEGLPAVVAPVPTRQKPTVSRAELKAWAATWRGVARVIAQTDPARVGPALSDADWEALTTTVAAADEWVQSARTARECDRGLAPRFSAPGASTLSAHDAQEEPSGRMAGVISIGHGTSGR